jgi:UPF0176 protein
MFSVSAHYKFFPLDEESTSALREELFAFGEEIKMSGLVLVGTEGLNGTVAADSEETLKLWKEKLESIFGEITFKDSFSKTQPFKRWFVKIRDEIVSLGDTSIIPNGQNNHLSPKQWDAMIDSEDVVLLDARNTYETEIGMFEGAVDPKIGCFQEFPEYIKHCDIPKDKKVLMYCTGGIRCEKASMEMQRQGYENVFQLDGGILRYMQERKNGNWKGECFVFDHRVAVVNEDLLPSQRYGLCPHCGDPGDRHITCEQCQKPGMMCTRCIESLNRQTCCKDCAYRRNRVLQKEALVR